MAIDDLTERPRRGVAWLEAALPDLAKWSFLDRRLRLQPCTRAELLDDSYLAGIAAVVLVQTSDKPSKLIRDLQDLAIRLLDWDCRIIIRPASDELAHSIVPAVNSLGLPIYGLPPKAEALRARKTSDPGEPPLPHIRVFGPKTPWIDVANFVADHLPSRPPSSTLRFDGPAANTLDQSHALMLRRAFADCLTVHLAVDSGEPGKSGATVYRVHAELEGGQIGQWPLPYFAKVGPRNKVYTEYVNYEQKVRHYVPFHLGPHLIRDRCHLGATLGVIVGDWVEESESLRQCASSGRAAPSIACLFDRTLIGWYRGARKDPRPLRELVQFPRTMPSRRIRLAGQFGDVLDFPRLRELFDTGAGDGEVYVGPVHGDLHAKNVRARGGDAIVIDFLAARSGPLISDAASLEASLLIEGFEGDCRPITEWLGSIECLYNTRPILRAPTHEQRKDPSNWFHASVRQIRLYGTQMELAPGQYVAALSVALLKKASKDLHVHGQEDERRAAAYLIASRVLDTEFAQAHNTPPEQSAEAS